MPGNKDLTSALSVCSIQPSLTVLLARPPDCVAVVTTGESGNPPPQATVANVAQAYPATSVQL